MKLGIFFTTLIFIFGFGDELADNILCSAMEDELNRNISSLRIANQKMPYYISYRACDREVIEIKATFGGLLSNNSEHNRDVYVNVRVGDYEFDNSNFICQTGGSWILESDHTNLPLEDDYDVIRHILWLVTDATYKRALERLSQKKATIQNRRIKEEIPDFSKEPTCQLVEPLIKLAVDSTVWENNIIKISNVFKKFPRIYESTVIFYARCTNQYFLDTEGNRSRRADQISYIEVSAKTQTDDGNLLENFIGFYSRNPNELSDVDLIIKKVEAMAETLSLQASLPKEEDYCGPVLFIGEAAAEVFFQILGKGVSAPRSPICENEMLANSRTGKDLGILANKIGSRIAPDFISAYDDPAIDKWNGIPLVGHFSIDDQGVRAQKVDIIKDGRLSGVLMSRAPIKKIASSNGHGRYRNERYGPGLCGMVGNLIIKSNKTKEREDLKKMMIEICQDYGIPYGIVVTRLTPTRPLTQQERYTRYYSWLATGSQKPLLSSPMIAYKVSVEDSSIELIRGLDFSSVIPRALRDIVATENNDFVYNFLYRDEEGNEYPMSVVTPSILVEEMEMVPKETKSKKLPLLRHPYFE